MVRQLPVLNFMEKTKLLARNIEGKPFSVFREIRYADVGVGPAS